MRCNRVLQITLAGALWLGLGGVAQAGPGITPTGWAGAEAPLLLARHDDHPRGQRGRGYDRNEARGPGRHHAGRGSGYREGSRWHRHAEPPRGGRGYGKHPHGGPPGKVRWSRGDVLPRHYRQPRYVIADWRARRYAPPPRGYQWIRVDGEALLVGLATGIILQSMMER